MEMTQPRLKYVQIRILQMAQAGARLCNCCNLRYLAGGMPKRFLKVREKWKGQLKPEIAETSAMAASELARFREARCRRASIIQARGAMDAPG